MGTEGNTDWLPIISAVYLILFTVAMIVGAYTTTRRFLRYRRRGEKPPLLLVRDVIARNSLAIPIAGTLLIRFVGELGVDIAWRNSPWWVIPTGGIAVAGAFAYVWFEYIIERDEKVRGRKRRP